MRRWSMAWTALAGLCQLVMAGCAPGQPTGAPAPQGVLSVAKPGGPSGSTQPAQAVTLELIMRDPDWMGRSPERPYWSDDGSAFYYLQKREDDEETGSGRDLVRVDIATGRSRVVPDSELGMVDQRGGEWSLDYRQKAWSRQGDLFVKDVGTGRVRQLTRTAEAEFDPRFLVDGKRIAFRRGSTILVRDLETGEEYQPADVRAEKDPALKKPEKGFLREQQERLFEDVREGRARREGARDREREMQAADPTRTPPPWYLGDDVTVRWTGLSPTGRWMLVFLAPKERKEGRQDAMPAYVTDDGYVSSRPVRAKAGTGTRAGDRLVLLDLEAPCPVRKERDAGAANAGQGGDEKKEEGGKKPDEEPGMFEIDLAALPGIKDDPLKELRAAAEERKKKAEAAEKDAKKDKEKEKESEGNGAAKEEPVQPRKEGEAAEGAKDDAAKEKDKKEKDAKPRPVVVSELDWSFDGSRVAIRFDSLDNKDRWLATLDLDTKKLVPLDRLSDAAWINGRFSDFGWLKDNKTVWFLSEESGYSQLYAIDVTAPEGSADRHRRLTADADLGAAGDDRPRADGWGRSGRFEVSDVSLSRDGRWLYYTANMTHPGVREFWRVSTEAGKPRVEQLTRMGGLNDFTLSPDESHILSLHSETDRPPEVYVQATGAGPSPGAARRMTATISSEFEGIGWFKPEVVAVPGREGRVIWSRVYEDKAAAPPSSRAAEKNGGRNGGAAPAGGRPAVLFVHGAGYLQDAHLGWSYYFHEFMFHTLLARRGYVVLDMDYRASAGYGRDWRTAIYRGAGGPELEDLEDGVAWLVKEKGVDPARVGVYGGSYGGFLTLMAMFKKPGLFACGAALRPVTDWAHYADSYTVNILNTPDLDPEAYEKSSPIEHAAGLKGRLLICHGMQDDNVFYQDTVRLTQKLIELRKENWEAAAYPVEAHGFREPSSWLDEYRRILRVFEQELER